MATHSTILKPENSLDRGAWWATVQRVAKSWTCLKQLGMHAPAMGVVCVSEAVDISPGLIPACDSFSLTFCMMYSAFKLNKQGNNIQPFPVLNQWFVPCPILAVAS